MIALSDAFLTTIYGALAWTVGAAVLVTAAGIALARAILGRKTR